MCKVGANSLLELYLALRHGLGLARERDAQHGVAEDLRAMVMRSWAAGYARGGL